MYTQKSAFDVSLGIKSHPSESERALFLRAQEYIKKISGIQGIEMIAVCNSLSMNATHPTSDIDLFIVTEPHMLWYVRFFVTFRLWWLGMWRHGEDIAGNFCLSFFITPEAMDLEKIAIKNDIYLFFWIYYMKPIFTRGDIYERFLEKNTWVSVDPAQRKENLQYVITEDSSAHPEIQPHRTSRFSLFLNTCIRSLLLPKTLRNYTRLGKPEGVVISDNMLKFHDQDKRKQIRDAILGKNFDK